MNSLKNLYSFLVDFLLPNRCPFCDSFIGHREVCCDDCKDKIEFCKKPIRYDENGIFSFCVSCVYYSGTAKDGILSLKYSLGLNCAKYLTPFLIENLYRSGIIDEIDLILAVPMNYRRKNESGYNHSESVAKIISDTLNIPRSFDVLKRTGEYHVQHLLSESERKEAVKDKYFIKDNKNLIKGKTILLCDDIITTGSTLSECSRLLLENGAEKVYCCTLATTNLKEGEKLADA